MNPTNTSQNHRTKIKIVILMLLAFALIEVTRAADEINFSDRELSQSCELRNEMDGQKLYRCHFPWTKKELLVLDLYGTVQQTAYYHGRLLRNEIEDGILAGIKQERYRSFVTLDSHEQKQFLQLGQCVLNSYKASVSSDYLQMVHQMAKGLKDAGSTYTEKELLEANFMVDLSIWFDTTTRKLEIDPKGTKRELMMTCGPSLITQNIGTFLKKMAKRFSKFKYGCTGVASSAAASQDKALVLGRNFDTGLLGYYEKHQLVLIQNNPNGIRSVGLATAGTHFAGGISGFNNYGLTASLHQLQSENTKIRYFDTKSDTTPYLLHKVLNSARSLEEAIEMIKKAKAFGAWTIFIADSKTDQIASIEMAGDQVVVARNNRHEYMAQSNHYLAPEMQVAGYEYSLGKTLESRARFSLVDQSLKNAQGTIDAQWVITMLSGHFDYLVGRRSFGRTTTKTYTAASHVMIPSRQEFWMSLGDQYPTNQSPFIGIRIGSDNTIQVLGATQAKREENLDAWYASQGEYVKAYMANEDNFHLMGQTEKAIAHLDRAIELAHQNGIIEFPYYLMRARLQLYKGALLVQETKNEEGIVQYEKAQDDLNFLKTKAEENLITTHPYERGLVLYWLAKTQDLKNEAGLDSERGLFALDARILFDELLKTYSKHHDFKKFTNSLYTQMTAEELLSEAIHFGTVE